MGILPAQVKLLVAIAVAEVFQRKEVLRDIYKADGK